MGAVRASTARRAAFGLSVLVAVLALSGLGAALHQAGTRNRGLNPGLPPADLATRPARLRAINIDLTRYTEAETATALAQLKGFGWLRQPFDLSRPDWPAWARAITQARAAGFDLIAVLFTPAPAPVTPDAFAAAAGELARRFPGQIAAYQVWDEPNLLSSWGRPPAPAEYARLLEATAAALRRADPAAQVLAGALAPTVETGPDNLSDLLFLQQLYDLGAAPHFDAAAGKPYGFDTGPEDRQADPQRLNFSRFVLLREVMTRNGDGHKLLWGGNFGWNTHPASPWGVATPAEQTARTLAAFARAEAEWPWAGPLALESYQPNAPAADPRWGFALAQAAQALTPLGQALTAPPSPAALPGNHTFPHPAARFAGAWAFSALGADIPEAYADAAVRISFRGSDLGLRVRRGDYRAYLYVTIDGGPANRLPSDDRGSYLVLTSPSLQPEVEVIPIASGLAPDQTHEAVIVPERGWGQWALAGFAVGAPALASYLPALVAALTALGALAVAWRTGRGLTGDALAAGWARLGDLGQTAATAGAGVVLVASAWATWETSVTALTRRFGDAGPILVTALTAGLFYWSPSFLLALAALVVLWVLFFLRLDLALAFIASFIPFFLFPRLLWERGASLLEFALWLAVTAGLARGFLRWRSTSPAWRWPRPSGLDLALAALVGVAVISTLTAARKEVAVYELRTVILGAAAYYGLLRLVPLDRRAVWRIVDFFLVGAVAVAGLGLYQYLTQTDLIVTEEGVARIRAVYGSPNNLGLYLGRALPVAVAVILFGRVGGARRLWVLAAAGVMGAALVLTFSRGALVLGVPAALAVLVIGRFGRRGAWAVAGALALAVLALPWLAQVPRFAGLLDVRSGTGFFRLNLWASAWQMFLDHPWLGVGPDNFLYAYRGFYILPAAWQEPNLSHPHNLALDFLSRLGVAGALCAAGLIGGFWRAAWRPGAAGGEAALRLGLMALVADMLAHGLVDHAYFLVDLAYVFSLALALIQYRAPDPAEPPPPAQT